MKYLFEVVLLFCINTGPSPAQGLFPLQTANHWYYHGIEYPYSDTRELIVEGEYSLPNGHSHAQIKGLWRPGGDTNYLRQASGVLYQYNPTDTTEYALMDFSAKVGDTI